MHQETIARWKRFMRSNETDARGISTLVLEACEILNGKEPAEQLRLLESNAVCSVLLQKLRLHKVALGLEDSLLTYLSFTLQLCYCTVVRSEKQEHSG